MTCGGNGFEGFAFGGIGVQALLAQIINVNRSRRRMGVDPAAKTVAL
jgi:hypothetical protein